VSAMAGDARIHAQIEQTTERAPKTDSATSFNHHRSSTVHF